MQPDPVPDNKTQGWTTGEFPHRVVPMGVRETDRMDAVEQVRSSLQPLLQAFLEFLEQDNPSAWGYFVSWTTVLDAMQEEDDVLLFFMEQLAPSMFAADRFELSFEARQQLDQLLAAAETIAATFSADDSVAH